MFRNTTCGQNKNEMRRKLQISFFSVCACHVVLGRFIPLFNEQCQVWEMLSLYHIHKIYYVELVECIVDVDSVIAIKDISIYSFPFSCQFTLIVWHLHLANAIKRYNMRKEENNSDAENQNKWLLLLLWQLLETLILVIERSKCYINKQAQQANENVDEVSLKNVWCWLSGETCECILMCSMHFIVGWIFS